MEYTNENNIIEELVTAQGLGSDEAIITIIGVGGAGGNAVDYMWDIGIRNTNINFIVCNTDKKAINKSQVKDKVQIGTGLGAGNDPNVARVAAINDIGKIRERLEVTNTNMIFIAAGMGGGTGTGASPVIAKLAREMGILTIAIVTTPLKYEGEVRFSQAMEGVRELRECVDSMIVISNENIRNLYLDNPSVREAFNKTNEILSNAAKSIAEIITVESAFVRVDFADVSKVLKDSGRAHMSVVRCSGADRAEQAAKEVLTSPLLAHKNITGARNILLHFCAKNSDDVKYNESETVLKYIQNNARTRTHDGRMQTATIIWGVSEKPELEEDDLELTLIAAGFDETREEEFADFYRTQGIDQSEASEYQASNQPLGASSSMAEAIVGSAMAGLDAAAEKGDRPVLSSWRQKYADIDMLTQTPSYIANKTKVISLRRGESLEEALQREQRENGGMQEGEYAQERSSNGFSHEQREGQLSGQIAGQSSFSGQDRFVGENPLCRDEWQSGGREESPADTLAEEFLRSN